MSALGHVRTLRQGLAMSALPPKADIGWALSCSKQSPTQVPQARERASACRKQIAFVRPRPGSI